MKKIFKKTEKNKGVAVLFAVLVAVLMLTIATNMASIAIRQTILSSTGRDSQYAMFAANTALECALFWDLNYEKANLTGTERVFPNSLFGENRPELNGKKINCNNGNIVTGEGFNIVQDWDDNNDNITTFYITIKPVDGISNKTYCANATVTRDRNGMTATTVIQARGYNTCELDSPRAIERGLELSYTS